jgi:DNA-binding protein HU-beta
MNKEELVNAISDDTEFTKTDSRRFLDSFLSVAQSALEKGDIIQLIGFGSFAVKKTKETKGRNPQTGKEITIPARNKIKFTAGKQLKEAVNKTKKK